MKEFQVSYYLHDMLHQYVEVAETEADAIIQVLTRISWTDNKPNFHDFKIERYHQPW